MTPPRALAGRPPADPKATSKAAPWRLRLLGDPALIGPWGDVHPLERRAAALLAVVAIEPGVSRQRLAALLWPDSEATQSRQALRQQLVRLKRLAGELLLGDAALRLAPDVHHDLAAEGPSRALLGDLDYSDCEELSQWLAQQRRQHLGRRHASMRQSLAEAEAAGDYDGAIAWAQRLAESDGSEADEALQRTLMRLHYLRGDAAGAMVVYDRLHQRLRGEHGAAPSAETDELARTIRAADAGPAPAAPRRRPPPAALLRPPRIVGRDRELAAMAQSWSEQRTVVLVGEAGLGKSRLLEALAAQGGDCVLTQARPGDANTPYASLARWLRALLPHADRTAPSWPGQALSPLLPELGLDLHALPEHRRLWLQSAVEAMLRAASGRARAVLVDDLHFADAASLELLQSLLTGESAGQMRWALAHRPVADGSPMQGLSLALDEGADADTVVLGPLDRNALLDLVACLGMPELDAQRLVPALLRHTGGNPLFALETLKGLWAQGGRGGHLPLPGSVTTLIERRLRQLSRPALGLARVAAIANVDFSIELAEQVLAVKALSLADAWHELEDAQVLRGGGFAHDLVFETTLASIPEPIARRTHAAVAEALEQRAGDAARIAHHWIDAAQPTRALAALHAAAESARLAMRPREQAQFLEQAAGIERDAGHADAAFVSARAAASARYMADRGALDEAAIDRLLALAQTPVQRASALHLRCELLTTRGDYDSVAATAEEAIALCGDDEALRCELQQSLGGAFSLGGQFRRAVDVMRQAQPWIEGHGSAAQQLAYLGDLAVALDNADRHLEAQAEHRRAITLALEVGEHANAVIILANLAVSLNTTGQLDEAIEALMRGERLAAAHDDARGAASTIPSMLSRCLRDQGRYTEALRWAEIGLQALIQQSPAWVPAMHLQMANTYLALGQHARAWQALDQAGAADALPPWQRSALWLGRARLKRALEKPWAAEVEQALASAPTEGRRAQRAAVLLAHAATLAPAPAVDVARRVHDEAADLHLQGVQLTALVHLCTMHSAAGQHAAAQQAAHQALDLARRVHPDDMYRAELWLETGRAFDRAGDGAQARAVYGIGAAWVRETAQQHVPEAFRDSFLARNAVNRSLLYEADRTGSSDG